MSDISNFTITKAWLLSSTNPELEKIEFNNPQRDPDNGPAGIVLAYIEESMYSPTISGEITIRDFENSTNQFLPALFSTQDGGLIGLGGYDIIRLEMTKIGGEGPQENLQFDLLIYAYSQESSETYSLYDNPRIIKLKVASPEFALMNYAFYEYFENDEDIIRPISRIISEENENPAAQLEVAGLGLPESGSDSGKPFTQDGIVQYLVNRLNDKMEENISDFTRPPLNAENTKNWVWLKRNYNFYPWGKNASAPLVNQLIQLLAENAVHADWDRGVKASNFFFWRTLDSWNFKSIESIVKQEPWKTYYLSPALDEEQSIRGIASDGVEEGIYTSYGETDYLTLLEACAFGANYDLVEPKYAEEPYARYLDTNGGHIIKEISYDYLKDGTSWSKLPQKDMKQSPIIGTSLNYKDKSLLAQLSQQKQIQKNYGYFNPGFYNKNKNVAWEYYGYPHSSRKEETLWQTQFDITDLDGQKLYWIEKEIKQKLKAKREEYARKKNLKEKWKVYRCSICCAGLADEFAGTTAQSSSSSTTGDALAGLITQEGAQQIDELRLGPFAGLETSPTQNSGSSGSVSFTDPRFLESFNLRNVTSSLSDYEVVAAGSFTDVLNYDTALLSSSLGVSGSSGSSGDIEINLNDPFIRSGMTLSYNLNESPYNMTLGEFMNLQKSPDDFVKYRFDLEILRHQKLKDILLNNIQARQIRTQNYANAIIGYTAAYLSRSDSCFLEGCTGYCLCPTEYPETVGIKGGLVMGAHAALANHEQKIIQQIDPVIEKLKTLKSEFMGLYSKFWSRKAFFFSKNIDFSFLTSGNNLFNIKSIKRMPIKNSKYAPFAIRKPLSAILSGSSGSTGISGSSGDQASSCYYPYGVTFFSLDGISGASGGSGGVDLCGIDLNTYYTRTYADNIKADFWYSFGSSGANGISFSNFPYSEPNLETPKGPIWYRNWLVSYDINLIKPPCLNRKPPCFDGDCSCDEIVIPLKMHFESFANDKNASVLNNPIDVASYALVELAKNCDGCKVRITSATPSSDVRLYHPWGADYLVPGFSHTDYVAYQKAASLFDDDLSDKVPPHLQLEGSESYVRVEFKTPIGLGTLQSFPEGFHDTYGSEYFLPYIVLATAGPFGSESARANISVIGQDPYGFDIAVKKIKNREDFAGMNLMYTDGGGETSDFTSDNYSITNPFSTSSSWLRNSQNSLFYKPTDGVADLFVPNGIQDIFMASALQKSAPVKSWWDLWVSLPPIAVATFYNRWDVYGSSGGSLVENPPEGLLEQLENQNFQGIAFYSNNSIVAEPISWTGDTGCSGGCESDKPWPLFLQPDTEQIISGAFSSDSVVTPANRSLESSGYLGTFVTGDMDPGKTLGGASYVLPSDPSNYVYRFAEFPHVVGVGPSGELQGIEGIKNNKGYSVVSYPVGTLIWGKNFESGASGSSGSSENDYNQVWKYDISRKTQYGIVQLNSDAMPSLLNFIGGIGGNIQKIEEYNRWVYNKVLDWYQNSIFDNNFSAQFVVMSKSSNGCGKEYPCMNPSGFPGIAGCPPEDPLCNCPCQGTEENKGKPLSTYVQVGGSGGLPSEMVLKPDLMDIVEDRLGGLTAADPASYGKEPSTLELQLLESEIYECELVKKHPQLGEEYLGCVWDDPESPYNCTCPKIGKKFPEYMKYNRTNATFWSTPLEAPLYRNAQMALFSANKIQMRVAGDLSLITGDVIEIKAKVSDKPKRFSGRWIVTTIKHIFNPDFHTMDVVLSRELPHPNSSTGEQTETGGNLDVLA
jgi:hypothetical protein